ncbi:hypothetical protein NKI63_30015, partial [Mesorhizobium sp. M0410]|uniref:hypothetical protein n=1 Tax=Mesorhizobium sp. M0410 TaxID=2956943 RepID=UPI0033371C28
MTRQLCDAPTTSWRSPADLPSVGCQTGPGFQDGGRWFALPSNRFEIGKKALGIMPRLDLLIVDIRQLRYFVGVVEAG